MFLLSIISYKIQIALFRLHVPFNLAPFISAFLRRDTISGFAYVIGDKVNRMYSLYGPKPYIETLKELVASLKAKGLVSASNKDKM